MENKLKSRIDPANNFLNIELRRCPDCGVGVGECHFDGCDVERCSVCGLQRIGCCCANHDRFFARWTGFWPGELEADALGIDLNEFYALGLHKIYFIKPSIES